MSAFESSKLIAPPKNLLAIAITLKVYRLSSSTELVFVYYSSTIPVLCRVVHKSDVSSATVDPVLHHLGR